MSESTLSSKSHKKSTLAVPLPLAQMTQNIAQQLDPYGIFTSIINAQLAWIRHPVELAQELTALNEDLLALQEHLIKRSAGLPSENVVTPHGDDVRFSEPVWSERATWDIVKELYLAITHRSQDMFFNTPDLTEQERRKAAFWARVWINAMAPTNFFWTNPVAIHKFIDTQGESLRAGYQNFMRDLRDGTVRMVEDNAFVVGKDLANTPGKVIFRNDLFELIHYTASTETVQKAPLLIVPPWINKYYILDLNQRQSMVRYLVDQGISVFMISWKNPPPDMANTQFEDYLTQGVQPAIQAVLAFCKVPKLHLAGYCIGGTLVSTYMAWANAHYPTEQVPVLDWTLFTTLTDFSNAGDISVFIEEKIIEEIEKKMAEKGYLDGQDMAAAFRLLRSNSLVWNYWVHSYLYGESLPALDVLFWNVDCTRMPAAMHSYYLRQFYWQNNLVKPGHIKLAGHPIDLGTIKQKLFAVSAEDDHIAPWTSCYSISKRLDPATPVEFVLSTSGHILGIINPVNPGSKRAYWAGRTRPEEDAKTWQRAIEKKPGSWWPHWVQWLKEHAPETVKAYPSSSKAFPALADAPGEYVKEK